MKTIHCSSYKVRIVILVNKRITPSITDDLIEFNLPYISRKLSEATLDLLSTI